MRSAPMRSARADSKRPRSCEARDAFDASARAQPAATARTPAPKSAVFPGELDPRHAVRFLTDASEMRKLWTILKSAAVGGVATAIDLLVLTVFVELLHLDAHAANVPALIAGVAFQFLGNKFFAFEDRAGAWAKQGAMFAAVEAGALTLNAVLFHLAISANLIPYLAARVLVQALVYFGFSLPLWTKIFAPQPQRSSI